MTQNDNANKNSISSEDNTSPSIDNNNLSTGILDDLVASCTVVSAVPTVNTSIVGVIGSAVHKIIKKTKSSNDNNESDNNIDK